MIWSIDDLVACEGLAVSRPSSLIVLEFSRLIFWLKLI
jgi:hypothetical protein